jgi:hypothetical protein
MTATLKIEVLDEETLSEIRKMEREKRIQILSPDSDRAEKILALSGKLHINEAGDLEKSFQTLRADWERD